MVGRAGQLPPMAFSLGEYSTIAKHLSSIFKIRKKFGQKAAELQETLQQYFV